MGVYKDFVQSAEGTIKRVVVVRLRPGCDLLLGLQEAAERYGIKNGVILSGIGSLDGVSFCNVIAIDKQPGYGYGKVDHFDGPIELTNATGIICHDPEGNINLHVHIGMSDRYGDGHGGHLAEGTKVLLTADFVLAEITGCQMNRKVDPDLKVPILTPEQN